MNIEGVLDNFLKYCHSFFKFYVGIKAFMSNITRNNCFLSLKKLWPMHCTIILKTALFPAKLFENTFKTSTSKIFPSLVKYVL